MRIGEAQIGVNRWVQEAFGPNNVVNKQERCLRLVEEAIELAQCADIPVTMLHAIIAQVYNKPKEPNPAKEIAGILVTAFAAATAFEVSAANAFMEGMESNWNRMDEIREHQKTKVRVTD